MQREGGGKRREEEAHLERSQLGLLPRRVQLAKDALPDLVVLAHLGRPIERVDVLAVDQVRLGLEELVQVVLMRDDDLPGERDPAQMSAFEERQLARERELTAIGLDAFGSACTAMFNTMLHDL